MFYTKVQSLEEYLNAIKIKNPEHVEKVRISLGYIVHNSAKQGINVENELKNIRTHYQAQLSLGGAQSNNIAIFAVLISLIVGFFSIVPSSVPEKLLFIPMYLFILFIMIGATQTNKRFNKKVVTYTIILQIIDELLESKDFH
ncbi:hypothetical protein NSQ38_15780 [Paenibacillus sp. FSL R7-0313]|uniref:hypothetical protein n=1 Tax=unclassified Paenibacillus TaxID=185978 RepID=UPI0030D86E66